MKVTYLTIAIIICTALSGCAVQNDKTQLHGLGLMYQSNVRQLDNGNYYLEAEAAPAAGQIQGALGTVNKRASDFCRNRNKSMKEIRTDVDTHMLVNGVARITFQCH